MDTTAALEVSAPAFADEELMELTTVATTAQDTTHDVEGDIDVGSLPPSPTMQGSWHLTKSWIVLEDDDVDDENTDALLGPDEAEEELFSHGGNLSVNVPLSASMDESHFDNHHNAVTSSDACSHTPPPQHDDNSVDAAREQLDTFDAWREEVSSSSSCSPVLASSEERASKFDAATIKKPTLKHLSHTSSNSGSNGSKAGFNEKGWIAKICDYLTQPLNDYLIPLVLSHAVTLLVGVYVGRSYSSSAAMNPTKLENTKRAMIGQAVAACL